MHQVPGVGRLWTDPQTANTRQLVSQYLLKLKGTTTGLNKIQAGGAECTPPRPETDDGSALNVEI